MHVRTFRLARSCSRHGAVKTALVSGSKHKPPTPSSFYHEFYAAQEPPDKTCVWLINTGRPYFTYVDYRPLKVSKIGEPPVTAENAYAALLGISYLSFYVVGWSQNKPDLSGLKPFEASMLRVWPMRTREVRFPPAGPALGHEELDKLADAPFGPADRSRST